MDYRHEFEINIVASLVNTFFLFMLLMTGVVGYSTKNRIVQCLITLYYIYIYFNVEFTKKRDYDSIPFKFVQNIIMCIMIVPLKELYDRADYFRRFGTPYNG